MLISRYFVWFVLFSVMGWMFETTYCTIKEQEWRNRGFLYGPVCPIYGSAAVTLIAVCDALRETYGVTFTPWQTFLLAFLGSIIFEYATSWALEKLFHAYWWDYSSMPLNINGRVCFPASVTFGLGGLLIMNILDPWVKELTAAITPLQMEFISLVVMALISADLTLTVVALTDFENLVADMEANLDLHMELFVHTLQERHQDMSRHLAEERERFTRESSQRTAQRMNALSRSALRRVRGFRTPENRKHLLHSKEHLLCVIHDHVPLKK